MPLPLGLLLAGAGLILLAVSRWRRTAWLLAVGGLVVLFLAALPEVARTLMVENLPGISADVLEAQLAHGKSGPLGMAYDRAEFMQQRVQMMRTWADYLDRLRRGADVLPLVRSA